MKQKMSKVAAVCLRSIGKGGGGVQLDIIFEKKKESAASKELVRPKQYAIMQSHLPV